MKSDRQSEQEAAEQLRKHLAPLLPRGGDYDLEIRYLGGDEKGFVFEAIWSANFGVSPSGRVSPGPSYIDEQGRDTRR